MAITIDLNPTAYWPICNDVEWVFSSTNNAQPNFSFIVEVYVNAVIQGTFEVFPEFQNYGKINISTIGRVISTTNAFSYNTLAGELIVDNTWSISVYEKYGTPPSIQLGSQTNSGGYNFLNGSLRYLDLYPNFSPLDYDIEQTRGEYFLTDFPRNRKDFVRYDSIKTLGIINSNGNACTLEVKLYDISNTLITTATVSAGSFQVPMLSVGPALLVAATTLTAGDFTNCYYYTVRLYLTASPTKSSEAYKLYYDQSCTPYDIQTLHWLNKYGSWDSYYFTRLSEDSTEVQTNRYNKSVGQWAPGTFGRGTDTSQQMVMSKYMTDRLILNSDWMHQDVQQWLVRELYESPRVYLQPNLSSPNYQTVIVNNSNNILKQRRKAGLIQEQVQIERSFTNSSQLG